MERVLIVVEANPFVRVRVPMFVVPSSNWTVPVATPDWLTTCTVNVTGFPTMLGSGLDERITVDALVLVTSA
jgi:hypothetical protein